MESQGDFVDGSVENSDSEEEFRSCFTENEEWQDAEESLDKGFREDLDETSLRMFFKGVSVSETEELGSRVSGIGVVMERLAGIPVLQVQKKLDFYVEELVADHLALMDGLLEALRNGIRRIYAFTDSEEVYDQIAEKETLEDQLLVALGQRILEHVDKLEDFVLKLVPSSELERPLRLAQEAIGIVMFSLHGDENNADDINLHQLNLSNRWRHCQQCRRVIELMQGCYHMTCWCGYEFCYSCGAEYNDGVQTCRCALWDDENLEPSMGRSNRESEVWSWGCFDSLQAITDGYSEEERAQLLLIQRFLSGEISLGDQLSHQSPPRCADSYIDTIKDLHQLPWLESFVSVISDTYHENFIQ